uniref:Uncharacterized protein n=1 Tax=Arundo donax TaxID=35708 RepID=A0A0A9CFX5_ARUDO
MDESRLYQQYKTSIKLLLRKIN